MEIQTQPKKSFIKRFWWLLVAFIILALGIIILTTNTNVDIFKEAKKIASVGPTCPDNLSGLLTYPIHPLDKIKVITPLGNATIPGHILPTDHNYINDFDEPTPLYSPGDITLSEINVLTSYNSSGNVITGADFTFTVCKGVTIVLSAGAIPKGNVANLINEQKGKCTDKPGKHEGEIRITTCTYRVNYKTKAGEIIGETQLNKDKSKYVSAETWAFNNNLKLSEDADWKYWTDSDYGHAFCLFDLYAGELKKTHEAKMGGYDEKTDKFTPRTIQPLCGQINQNLKDTAQGSWFSRKKSNSGKDFTDKSTETDLSLIHNNIDPTLGRIVVGGTFIINGGIIDFTPAHSGTINREFSEVKADGKVYCYEDKSGGGSGWGISGKILLQVIDNNHLKIEHQDDTCGTNEKFKSPFNYER